MSILLLGLNYKSATVEIREKVSLSKSLIIKHIPDFQALAGTSGIVVLSTCNRTEFYLDARDDETAVESLLAFMEQYSGFSKEVLLDHLYHMSQRDAVDHLYTVVAGLDSMILGESQIQGQVQEAYNLALEHHLSDNVLNTMFMTALSLGKRVRTETFIDRQAVSVSSAAVELAKQQLSTLENKTVLILGAGETSELAARHLVANGISGVIVANRTFERAQQLAAEFGGDAVRFDEFYEFIESADIIISATASPRYILEKADLEPLVQNRTKPLLFMDIAVPRDIDPAVAELPNVVLFDIDDMQHVVAQNLAGRQKEAVKARAIIDEEVDNFFFWMDSLVVVPTITKLRNQAYDIRTKEVEKAIRRIDNITPREEWIINTLASSMVNQWLHKPMYNLRNMAGEHADRIECYINAINDLFELPMTTEEKDLQSNCAIVETKLIGKGDK